MLWFAPGYCRGMRFETPTLPSPFFRLCTSDTFSKKERSSYYISSSSPSSDEANRRYSYDFVESVDSDMDGRWGSNADGSCAYDHECAKSYSEFLRTIHPEFVASE